MGTMGEMVPTWRMVLRALALICVGLSAIAPAAGRTGSPLALIMVDDPSCRYCRKFEAEVEPGYSTSPFGRIAPLVKLRRGSPELKALGGAPANYTPTFILVRDRRELGRITGYPGAGHFYEELGSLLDAVGESHRLSREPAGHVGRGI